MFVILAIFVGILIGVLRKGQLSGLFSQKISLWYIGAVGLLAQFVLHLLFYTGLTGSYITIINFISYVLILITLVFNLNHVWAILATVGFTSNFLAVFLNGGFMPVAEKVLEGTSPTLAASITNQTNAVYMLMNQSATRLWFLGDVVRIPGVGPVTGLYGAVPSIAAGTLLILIGLAGWVQRNIACEQKQVTHVFDDDDDFGTSDDIIPKDEEPIFQEQPAVEGKGSFEFSDLSLIDSVDQDDEISKEIDDQYRMEETLTDLTEYIPRLTPEMIAEIRRNSLEESEDLLNEGSNDNDNTRVFTAFGNMNEKEGYMTIRFEDEESQKSSSVAQRKGIASDIEDEKEPVESRWTSWNPTSLNDEIETLPQENRDVKTTAGQPVSFDDDLSQDEQKKNEWNPQEVERNTYAGGSSNARNQRTNPYSTLYNVTDAPAKKGRSSEEMLDIWHRASETDFRNRRVHYKPEEPVKTQNFGGNAVESEVRKVETAEVAEKEKPTEVQLPYYEQKREDLAKQWDAKTSAAQLISLTPNNATERVDSKELLRKSLTEKDEQKTAQAVSDLEREKAGYEKVELEIEGRVVSFWRKKKE